MIHSIHGGLPRPASRGRFPAPAPSVRGTEGFVVLAFLLLVVGSMIAAVLLGKLVRYQYPHSYILPSESRELRRVIAAAPVRLEGHAVRWVQPGDSVWTRRLPDGSVAVFLARDSERLLGFVSGLALGPAR